MQRRFRLYNDWPLLTRNDILGSTGLELKNGLLVWRNGKEYDFPSTAYELSQAHSTVTGQGLNY